MNLQIAPMIGWLFAASVLGFGISAVFAGWLKLSRNIFLIPYVSLVGIFLYTFVVLNNIDVVAILVNNWVWGVLLGVLTSILLVRQVKSQPASRQSNSSQFALDVLWAGLVYGMTDALFLNIMPVVAVWVGMSQLGWSETLLGKIGIGIIGLLASLLVAFAYHLGYPEFRGQKMRYVFVGNGIITLATILSGNPFGSLISHTVMHIAAVFRGAETTVQLPPHYQVGLKAS